MKLGGSANMLDDFPEKPKGMHWRTYERLCRFHDAARARSFIGLTDFAKRIRKRAIRPNGLELMDSQIIGELGRV
jgi:hypothetical protein